MDSSDKTPDSESGSKEAENIREEKVDLDIDTSEATAPTEEADDKSDTIEESEPQSSEPESKTRTNPITQFLQKLSPKQRLLYAGAALLILASAGYLLFSNNKTSAPSQSTQSTTEKRLGIAIGLIEGTAEYSSDNGKNWQKLTSETDLKEGNNVRTTDGRTVLLVDDGSAVRLDANSQVKINDLAVNHVVITNVSGDVYSRVVASSSRSYEVKVNDETYKAKGTAYRTINKETKKGVEVFHSTVSAESMKTDVSEGNYLLSKSDQADKTGKVLALDVEALKADAFIKWNYDQDKKTSDFADKLGVLTQLDKPAATPPATPKPTATTSTAGITLAGKASDYSAVFSWKVSGVDVSKGYKLVRSKKTSAPTYPNDGVAYIEAGKTSYTLTVGDGVTYYYRLCAYTGSGCSSYSNAVTVTTATKPKATVQSGTVTLSISSGNATWTYGGTAPYGFKVVIGTSSGPTYENNYKKLYTEGTNYNLTGVGLTNGTTYYVKVCKYTDGGCTDYSNEVVYTP